MRIEVFFVSPSGGGEFAAIGPFLLEGLPPVGRAIEVIEVELLLLSQPSAPTDPHEEVSLLDLSPLDPEVRRLVEDLASEGIFPGHPEWSREHDDRRAKGSALTFRRASRRVDAAVVSELSEREVSGRDDATPEIFAKAAHEVVRGLEPLRRRVRAGDDVDATKLLAHLAARLDELPRTHEEPEELERPPSSSAGARQSDRMPLAPGLAARLADPFFVDPADEEAPHGNDTGADLLASYLDARPADGWSFLDQQAQEMGFASLRDLSSSDLREHDAMVIAFVFAELMVRGQAPDDVVRLALDALARREAEAPSPRNEQMRSALTA